MNRPHGEAKTFELAAFRQSAKMTAGTTVLLSTLGEPQRPFAGTNATRHPGDEALDIASTWIATYEPTPAF